MALLNKASEDEIISPDTVITTTEMQNDVVVQPPAANTIQLHSIKPHILSIIFNQFLTIREMLTLRNTCQHFKILLFQKNDNTADVVMFCKHSGSKELDNVPLIWSNLDRSSEIGHLPIIQYLIMKNVANVNQTNNDGESPLLVSSRMGRLRVVQYLVDHGADVNQGNNDGKNPLLVSSRMCHLRVVQYLVQNGADVNQTNNDGESPLFVSSRNGFLSGVQYLVQNGADVNQRDNNGETPLFMSSRWGHLSVVQYLVDHGANVNQTNNEGESPHLVSSRMGHLRVASYLAQNGAVIE